MQATDFLLNPTTGDLLIQNGTFVIGPSDNQHIEDIIIANPGDWKQYPKLGVGIDSYINGSDLYELNQSIKTQLVADGYSINNINIKYDPQTNVFNVKTNANRT